jgi:hypothetical protein
LGYAPKLGIDIGVPGPAFLFGLAFLILKTSKAGFQVLQTVGAAGLLHVLASGLGAADTEEQENHR